MEAGADIFQRYLEGGLSCFREAFETGSTRLVREGYIIPKELPNGTVLMQKFVTSIIPRDKAERER